MKSATHLTTIGCIVFAASSFVAADSPSRPKTPITPELIDPSAYAEWVDGVERPMDTQRREQTPQWVLWADARNVQPGHSGVTFGNSKSPGARHLRIGFRQAIPVGSVVVRGGGTLSVLKTDAAYPGDVNDDSQWIPAGRLVDAERTRNPILETRVGRAIQQGVGLWTLPPGVKTRAIRFTHVAQPADESYAGRLGGVMVLTQRLANLAPLATPAAGSNQKHVARIMSLPSMARGIRRGARPITPAPGWQTIRRRRPQFSCPRSHRPAASRASFWAATSPKARTVLRGSISTEPSAAA